MGIQVNSLFERIPRRRGGDRWSADLEELEEEVEAEEGEECWGCGAKSCVFKRARYGRLLCRPGRPRGEIIYTAGKAFRDLVQPGSTCWGDAGESSIRIAFSIGRRRRRKRASEESLMQGREEEVWEPSGCCACKIYIVNLQCKTASTDFEALLR